ncbi:MAG: T9SS type A sorting domain-containing protein [Flavobacteriales bacterium]
MRITSITLLLPILFLYSPFEAFAQSIQWENNFGGGGEDQVFSIEGNNNSGYIITGVSDSASGDVSGNQGGDDAWFNKLSNTGSLSWERNYGGSGMDGALDVIKLNGGGYFVLGGNASTDGDNPNNIGGLDYWLMELDGSGNLVWDTIYGGSNFDLPHSMRRTDDGGYIICGSSASSGGDLPGNYGGSDLWLLKLDSTGAIDWSKHYGGAGDEYPGGVQQLPGGGYLLAGTSDSADGDVSSHYGQTDVWLLKLDASGNIVWEQNYGGMDREEPEAVGIASDEAYMIVGSTASLSQDVSNNYGSGDAWVLKVDSSGTILWERNFGGTYPDEGHDIEELSNGEWVVGAMSASSDSDLSSNNGSYDLWTLRLDNSGNIIWKDHYGGPGRDELADLELDGVGGFVLGATSDSAGADVSGNNGGEDYWALRINDSTTAIEQASGAISVKVHPNPFRKRIRIRFQELQHGIEMALYDVHGQRVYRKRSVKGRQLSLSPDLEKGIYFLRVRTEQGSFTRKILRR